MLFRSRRKKKLPSDVPQLPSRQILAKIDHLRGDIIWKYEDGYYRFLDARFKIERIATMKQAIMIVEALKAMLKRQEQI